MTDRKDDDFSLRIDTSFKKELERVAKLCDRSVAWVLLECAKRALKQLEEDCKGNKSGNAIEQA